MYLSLHQVIYTFPVEKIRFFDFQFVPRKASDTTTGVGSPVEAAPSASSAASKDYAQPSTSGEQQKFLSGQAPQLQQFATMPGNPAVAVCNPVSSMSGSSTLPHSMTWAPQITAGQFQSMQSLDQRGLPAISYYPIGLP
ncbi:unnamed protein product [Gongylonema pulchrum]|uniref:Uncharacterized protein n=1 Tax=Gongylonema pulchrum TaxID=637853 RepID=A0A3P7PQP0_9BILA|nr:unnamed protein product [Gongylonema pulchrum]